LRSGAEAWKLGRGQSTWWSTMVHNDFPWKRRIKGPWKRCIKQQGTTVAMRILTH